MANEFSVTFATFTPLIPITPKLIREYDEENFHYIKLLAYFGLIVAFNESKRTFISILFPILFITHFVLLSYGGNDIKYDHKLNMK